MATYALTGRSGAKLEEARMRKTLTLALAGLTLSTSVIAAAPASAQVTSADLQRTVFVQTGDPEAHYVQQIHYPGRRYYRDRYYGGGYYGPRHYGRGYYRDHYYGPRYRGYYRDDYYYRRRHRDNDAALAAGVVGFALGAAIAGSAQPRGYSPRCYRYRSFDPYSGTYIGYDGRVRRCY